MAGINTTVVLERNTKSALDAKSFVDYRNGMEKIRELRIAKGYSQQRLAELAGTSQPQIKRLESGERELTKVWAQRLAPHLGVSAVDLMFESAQSRPERAASMPKGNASNPINLADRPLTATLPRYRSAYAGQGGAVLMDSVQDEITAPPVLAGIEGSFACFVHGDSMEPFLFAGDTVFCHGFAPPRGNDFVVIQVWESDEHGHLLGLVKQFVKQDAESVTVRQFNPLQEFTFPRERVKAVNKVVQIEKL